MTGGGLSPDGTRWIATRPDFLFPTRVLGALFRGKFLAASRGFAIAASFASTVRPRPSRSRRASRAFATNSIAIAGLSMLTRPSAGPSRSSAHLGRYTHRVGLSNRRLVALDARGVTFRTRGTQTATLAPDFLGRFLLHVLRKGFVKIRHHGLMAASHVNTRLVLARRLLEAAPRPANDERARAPRDIRELLLALTGVDLRQCPRCGATAVVRRPLPPPATTAIPPDTS